MCPSYTTHYNLAKPDVNNPDDEDLWGGYLNGDMDIIDTTMYTIQQGIYPVGSIYMNISDATNPATLLGFGTWTALAGLCLVGVGTGTDSNGATQTFTAGVQVGEYVHTLTTPEIPAHTHTDSGHTHPPGAGIGNFMGTSSANSQYGSGPYGNYNANTGIGNANIQNTGGGGSHNNVMPVIGAYMWQRTA